MFETADPKHLYYVANRVRLFPEDEKVLIKLYQPLVGAVAVALYQTLIQNYDPYGIISDSKGIYSLQEQLDCSLKQLFNSLHKLEAVGLVQTFLSDNVFNNVLVFKLLQVPAADKFFATPLLASLLKEKVGVPTFHDLSHAFAQEAKLKEKPIKNAKDVSANFFDVFRLPGDEAITPSSDVVQAAQENKVHEVETAKVNDHDSIDWDFIKQEYSRYQIPASEIDLNKEQIRGLIQTYGLSEKEFVDESLPCLHGSYSLNMRDISNTLAENYKRTNTRENVQAQLNEGRKKALVAIKDMDDNDKKLLKAANESSPAEFLYKLKTQKGGITSANEKQIINNLHTQYGLPEDLINILTYTCLTYDTVVSSNLAYKIANDWLQHGVATAVQALQYVKKRRNSFGKKRPVRTYQKRVEKGTDWSKKKADRDAGISTEQLKNLFKDLNNK
ncbi:replication initiation and membrane attachment family protein [Lactobacillus helveticus]|jgi:replication initiation and membrane attachment protein|uniref:Chromosome replication initiation n=2 Tax=Lactobacillus helveticus TaxID=1587 RepID=U4QMV7_LACHE|nr:DnaD domain protein [Lactobacillus helveticus]ADX69788.1 Replicative DNA helicase loader DnaB [Lactobacillus helveticus H10]AUI75847.1 chromosome replication initiation protein [Lactobacillus helveticus]NHL91289.1 chromosome replication initiation protein [Lactobacillus helveticus]NRN73147.1 Replication initiation and membrane attachment protein [Lactobacillus helveticus]NRN74756.1 Replication initiation and membrane attachment protein [Lactobacillus helveticus]